MARPKKRRELDGVRLEDNLYPDNKGRSGHYRYLRPDGTFKHFTAETPHRANDLARKANALRDEYVKPRADKQRLTMLGGYVEDFIEYRERQSPGLQGKASWRNRGYQLRQFGREIKIPFSRLSKRHIDDWWHGLTHHQQKARHAEFRRLFNYLMGRDVLPNFEYNPFTTADDRPRLYLNERPERTRKRLTRDGFWRVYQAAGRLGYEGLQVAMGLALTTFLREHDILTTRLSEHLDGDLLKRVISKSAAQKGHTKAARLQWDVGSYDLLRQVIKKGRELSLKNGRCPFLVSHKPKQRRIGKTKEHYAQVTPKRLQEMFSKSVREAGCWDDLPTGMKPPTFHEIRSLADALATEAGYDISQIQHAMAHSDEAQTLMYQANQALPYEAVAIIFTEQNIGGNFQ